MNYPDILLLFVKSTLMQIIPWYTVDLDISSYPSAYEISCPFDGEKMYEADVLVTVARNDPLYIEIQDFLQRERDGWKYDLNTYAPFTVFSSADKEVYLNINCMRDLIVVNYRRADGELIQVYKKNPNSCPAKVLAVAAKLRKFKKNVIIEKK